MGTIKVGIIGAGRIGKIHIENLQRQGNAEVVAVSDPFADEALRQWAAERGIRTVTKDAAEWMDDPAIQAVFICSPTDTHVPFIKLAAAAGKHIFCEKPISMEVSQTAEALEAVKAAGVQLQVGFNRRFDHNFKRIKEIVSSGEIGQPHIVKITSRDPSPPGESYIRSSGGIFMDMMIHDFDMARYVSGEEAVTISAVGSVLVDPVFEQCGDVDTAVVTIQFASGAIGIIDNSRKAVYGYDQRVEVFGSGGAVGVNNDYPNTAEIHTEDGVRRDNPLHFFLERYNEAYADEARQFIACLAEGRQVPVNGEDGMQAELMACAAAESLRLGRPVPVKLSIAAE
ncbi:MULTISPECIES: inositol 2-dehydrogenase [Paenibacillus]|uniref:Inositol 2-dehydrogenase n=1 Tax=Paenibacillus campinasensis TaxID=66347 RepID=A0A268F4B3_9BACL|nr:inositol 2-dehydrogenase [Paenibacillus campinasensis]MUG64484.1 inositol 2-dehydrogenase [Paenibacillus campinasensis]PAD80217.1 inositol 2-dehydrogenase [Paenibacillus campinasensis]